MKQGIPSTNRLIDKLHRIEGFQLVKSFGDKGINSFYLTGGALRNYLIDEEHPTKDLDIFYSGNLDLGQIELLSRNGSISKTPFGSIRWYPNNSKKYFDLVSFSDVRLIDKVNTNINGILKQFDITANAIALDINELNFYDPVGGVADIKNKIVKIIRYDFSDEFISTDCHVSLLTTQWFRSIHYSSVLQFELDDYSKKWVCENSWRIKFLDEFIRKFFPPDLTKLEQLIS